MNGKHVATNRTGFTGLIRSHKIIAASIILILVTAVVAFALLMFRAPIVGDVEVNEAPQPKWTGATLTKVLDTSSGTNCSVALMQNPNRLSISLTGLPNSHCDISVYATSFPEPAVVVQSIQFSPDLDLAFLNNPCNKPLPVDDNNSSTAFEVRFRITIPDGTAVGVYPASADAGLVAVFPEDFVLADCPTL